jgi:phage portal protein BeeE
MGLINWVKDRFSNFFGAVRRGVLSFAYTAMDIWPSMTQRDAIDKGYAKILAIFAIINKDAAKFGTVPRYVYDAKAMADEKGVKLVEGKDYDALMKLLRKPNPGQTQCEFFEACRIMFKGTHECFIWLNRGDVAQRLDLTTGLLVNRTDKEMDAMPVLEMYVLPSGFVGIIPDPDNVFGALGYWFDVADGKKIMIRKGDIIHWRKYNPVFDPTTASHLHGLSPTIVGKDTIQEHQQIIYNSRRMFKNDGAKAIMIDESGAWIDYTEEQRDILTGKINQKLNNPHGKGSVATFGGKWQYVNIAQRSVDMDTIKAKSMTWQELCFLYDIPYEFFASETKYNNAGERAKQWVSNCIIPACQLLDEKLTEALTVAFNLNGKAVILSDFTKLPELQKNLTELATAFNTMWYVSPNQKLVAAGYEPIKNPIFDEPWIPQGMVPLSQYQAETQFQEESDNMNEDEL